MKKCIKGVISILICLVFVAGSVSIGLNSITAKAYNSWQDAYNDFTLNSKYRNFSVNYYSDLAENFTSDDKLIYLFLYDMDTDGTPELFMSNGDPGQISNYAYIFTYSNGNIKQLSTLYHNIGYTNNSKYKGVFSYSSYYGSYYYYEKNGQNIKEINISNKNRQSGGEPEIYNQELYDCEITWFSEVSFPELRKIGWSAFCKKYGYTVSETSESTSKSSDNNFGLTSTQKKDLEKFLQDFYAPDFPTSCFEFDCTTVTRPTIMENILRYGVFGSYYPGKADYNCLGYESKSDPRGIFKSYGKYSYDKSNVNQVDWVLKNILNCNDDYIKTIIKYGEKDLAYYSNPNSGQFAFYKSGNYYYSQWSAGIGGNCDVYAKINSVTKDGDNYLVYYSIVTFEYDDTLKTPINTYNAYAQLQYKKIDGKYYWSLYKNSKTKFDFIDTSATNSGENNYTIKYTDGTSDTFDHNLDYYISKADSTKYDPELAYILMSIAYAAYSEDTVKDMFETLEFTQINTSHETYKESNEVKMLENKIRYGLGAKTMSNGKTLVLIDIAGTNGDPLRNGDYLGPSGEWLSDLDLGFITQLSATGYHHGFEQAADYLIKGLNSFLSTNNIKKSEAIFAVTGHSRGAAVGNIVSCKLGVKKSNLYNYNFACPDVAVDTGVYWNLNGAHDNIFNISCNQDIVSMVPGYLGDLGIIIAINQWGKYGKSLWFCHDWSDMKYDSIKLNSHEQNNYLKYLRQKRPESELKDYFAMKANIPNPLKWNGKIFGFLCPVDVKLTDDNGKVIAEVIDNKITQKDENVFIIINQDHKIVIVPDTEHTNVQITGTDEGEMTLLMRNFDSNSRNVTDSVDFKNVEVHKDKTILTEWGGNIKSTDTVLKDGETGEIINADKTEDSVKNDSVGEKKDNKTALYIIIAVAAAAAIAAVTAVIIIKKRKSKKAAETGQRIIPEYENAGYEPVQNENAYTAPPSPPIQPVNSANGAETAEKKPETLVKYACKPTGRPGQCAKCKSDTAQLYFIVAEKSGKRQSITVCKDCAEKIITRFKKQNQESDRT